MFNFQLEQQSARTAHINSTAADKRLVQFLYIFPVYCPLEPEATLHLHRQQEGEASPDGRARKYVRVC